MTLQALQRGGLELVLAGVMTILLAGPPERTTEAAASLSPAAGSEEAKVPRAAPEPLPVSVFPGAGAMVAGAILLVPFGLSMLRIRGRSCFR